MIWLIPIAVIAVIILVGMALDADLSAAERRIESLEKRFNELEEEK
jgi:hypothetical protein